MAALSVALVAAVALPDQEGGGDSGLRADLRSAEGELDGLAAEVDSLTAREAADRARIDAYRTLRNPEGIQAIAALNDLVAQEVCGATGAVDRGEVVDEAVEALAAYFPALADIEGPVHLVDEGSFDTGPCPDTERPSTPPPTTTAPAPTTTAAPAATTAPPALTPGGGCALGSDADCIDPDGDGSGTYLIGGGRCMATYADSPGLCNDLDGDGNAGYPDSG